MTRLAGLIRTPRGAVMTIVVVVWGLTLFDLTLRPRAPVEYLHVFGVQRVIGVVTSPDTHVVSSTDPTTPTGPWYMTPERGRLDVVGTHYTTPKSGKPKPLVPRLRATLPDPHRATAFDIDPWRGGQPSVFEISSPDRNPIVDAYSLGPRARHMFTSAVPQPPLTADRRDYFVGRWSGPLPDLFVLDRYARRRKPQSEPINKPWVISIYSGESGFSRRIDLIQMHRRLSRRLSRTDWWPSLASRHGRPPSLVMVIREERTSSHRVEIHALSGSSRFQDFSLHVATELPQRLGTERQFLFQSSRRGGGAMLMVGPSEKKPSVRALVLP